MTAFLAHVLTGAAVGWLIWRVSPIGLSGRSPKGEARLKGNEMIRITIFANKTFRGVIHFEEANYDASDDLAHWAVKEGIARYASLGGMHLSDPNSFKGPKGPTD